MLGHFFTEKNAAKLGEPKRGYGALNEQGLSQNGQIHQFPVIPSKTATHWVAVLRGNPPLLPGNGLPRQCAHRLAMTGFR